MEATLRPADGSTPIDGAAGPGACVIELALGFSNRPNRFARAPISFRSATPGPTTTSTTTPAPGPAPTPPPARPVVRAPSFTG